MKRPVLAVCTRCRSDDAVDGESFFEALRRARKEKGYKPLFKLKESGCLKGCDTPCNAVLSGKEKETLFITWLDGEEDVDALLEGAARYARAQGPVTHRALKLPGRADTDGATED